MNTTNEYSYINQIKVNYTKKSYIIQVCITFHSNLNDTDPKNKIKIKLKMNRLCIKQRHNYDEQLV